MIEPFDTTQLPTYDRGTIALINGALVRLGEPAIRAIESALATWCGATRLRISSIVPGIYTGRSGVRFHLTRAGISGQASLFLDPTLIALLMTDASSTDDLGEFEFGYAAVAVADVFDQGRQHGLPPIEVRPAPLNDSPTSERAISISIDVTVENTTGVAKLVVSERWLSLFLESVAPSPRSDRFDDLAVRGEIFLGSLPLDRGHVRDLEPGDVLFPDHGLNLDDIIGTDDAFLRAAGLQAAVRVNVDGANAVCEIRSTWTPSKAMADSIDMSQTEPLADAAVDVEVRLGETSIRLGELSGVAPGYVFELNQPIGASAEILVNGQTIGRGELVNVDGRLGVRVTSMNR